MKLRLQEISARTYAREVLPLTQPVWGGARSLETYVSQTRELAQTGYGRKHYATFALSDGTSAMFASFKRYEREAHARSQRLRAVGIGAVFTPAHYRGQGYASAMLGLALDRARNEGFDFAYLFSDIRPHFYKELGFKEAPSRVISLRASDLNDDRICAGTLEERDWPAVRRCFQNGERARRFGITRTPLVWGWIRTRLRQRGRYPVGQPIRLCVRRGKEVAAYTFGQREPTHDAYVLDEYGFADDDAALLIAPLLRLAAGDLRRVVAWLPPWPARDLLARGCVRRRTDAVWMIAPLTGAGSVFLGLVQEKSTADGIWSLDHI